MMRRFALVHLLANTILLWLGYYWLGIGESRAATLAWSGLIALVMLFLACSIYGAAFAYSQAEQKTIAAWRSAMRNLLPLALAAVAVVILYFLLARWAEYSSTPANQVASYLTLKLRKPVKPLSVLRVFSTGLWLVRWVLLPVLLLPMIAAIASHGWRGYRDLGALARKWWYWIEAPVLLLAALWVPLKLLAWVPNVGGFGMESVSFVLRAAVAYLLFVAAWLALALVTSGGSPRFTQPKTVVSP